MPKVSPEILKAVQDALDRYEREVEDTPLATSAQNTYLLHARHFVRWLDDDFEPGATLKK